MQGHIIFDLVEFLRIAHKKGLRYVLIGRWAVAQHGAPVVTSDYDFWVHPRDRKKFFKLMKEEFDAEIPSDHAVSPILSVYVGPEKIDVFFMARISNKEGETLQFDDIYKRAEIREDPREHFQIRFPSIDDLIALKRMHRSDPQVQARDEQDIVYLQQLKAHRSKKKRKKK